MFIPTPGQFLLNGITITIEDIWRIAHGGQSVRIDEDILAGTFKTHQSRPFYGKIIEQRKIQCRAGHRQLINLRLMHPDDINNNYAYTNFTILGNVKSVKIIELRLGDQRIEYVLPYLTGKRIPLGLLSPGYCLPIPYYHDVKIGFETTEDMEFQYDVVESYGADGNEYWFELDQYCGVNEMSAKQCALRLNFNHCVTNIVAHGLPASARNVYVEFFDLVTVGLIHNGDTWHIPLGEKGVNFSRFDRPTLRYETNGEPHTLQVCATSLNQIAFISGMAGLRWAI